ncbi:asparagine synthase (glutamine-hydrolyzing) [Actinocorallia sp. A-T 12471]|uniref:asparagine synthase (glutamine-hydrolyzing) n=1 Tax=Actinocorallia sp. A-T 12471 TaxID=3089813 RepID=UPI0029CE59A3|nr:asparagine synthase (glutamine-hydrolyzing) [Actinocorallia sp. A-T 12471]MDX6740719.1 asparagine synthase (glutamine-hydrolyzing) [Actinocorallia sp. A-T 12471]
MCGLAGFTGEASERVVKPMVEALACRGPDAQALWVGDGATLGHTRLAIVDLVGGRQPMQAGRAVLAFTGEVYNHRELRAELGRGGHRFATVSDTEVVLAGYLAWGDGVVARLEGMFAFAVWEPARRRLLLARDRLGVKPLYYQRVDGGVRFASEPKALLAHPEAGACVDLDGLRELLLSSHPMTSTPGRSPFCGIAQLPPGCVLVATPERTELRRYWRLEPREHTDDLPTTIDTVRGLLDRAVRGELQADVPRCTLLSGGLDSSVIAALVGAGQDTVSVEVGAAHGTDPMRRGWDAPYVALMAERLESSHRQVALAAAELADPALREQVVAAKDGLSLGDFDFSALLLFRAVAERHKVALSGEAADEIFGGYRWFQEEAVGFPWSGVLDRGDLARLLDPGLARLLDLDGYRRALYESAAAEIDHPASAGRAERRLRINSHLNLSRFLPGLLSRTDRLSMSCGLEVRVPFCDHRLVEYVFNVPWAMKSFDGREKSLLRAAARGLVPGEILRRRKSPYPMVRDAAYRAALAVQVEDLLGGDGPALELLDAVAVRGLLLDAGRADRFPREGLEFVLDLDVFLRLYRPTLELR